MTRPLNTWFVNLALAALTLVLLAASVYVGRGGELLTEKFRTMAEIDRELAWLVLTEVRLPRALLGLLVGATLGLTGAGLQGLLRNPLAEPGLINALQRRGARAAVLVFYFGMAVGSAMLVPLGGIAGALAALATLYLLVSRNPSIVTIILAGVAISAFCGALTSLALNLLAKPLCRSKSSSGCSARSPITQHAGAVRSSCCLSCSSAGFLSSPRPARSMRCRWVRTPHRRSASRAARSHCARFLSTGLAVGAAVSVTGVIGFVGLVVPHLMRSLVGPRPASLLLPSASPARRWCSPPTRSSADRRSRSSASSPRSSARRSFSG